MNISLVAPWVALIARKNVYTAGIVTSGTGGVNSRVASRNPKQKYQYLTFTCT